MSPERQILVSTHFDDIALSLVHVLHSAGPEATVVTVCGGEPPRDEPVSEWDARAGFASGWEAARARAREDRNACAITGARPHPLGHADSPYCPLPDASHLRAEIERLLQGDCVLWLPAGIGNADHAHVRDALLPLAATLAPGHVRVYADLPYAGSEDTPGATEVRLTGPAFERKLAAVRCHESQVSLLQETWPDLLERDGPLTRERHWNG